MIRASLDNRAKESLVVDFISQTNLDAITEKIGIISAFYDFAKGELKREANALIDEEGLNAPAAKRYIENSLKRGYASENGEELKNALPKMSPLDPNYLPKKQSVFQKIADFVRKFLGIAKEI